MMKKTHMFSGMLTASALMVGLSMGQSPDAVKRAPVPKGAPLVQQRVEQAPAKEPSVSDPAQTEEGRRLHAKRSKDAVELRKSQFDRELAQL